jgi:ATP-binding cassette subfamily F protein uup
VALQSERARALAARREASAAHGAGRRPSASAPSPAPAPGRAGGEAKKLSYREQRELDALPARIEALELEQKELAALLGSADFYADDPARVEQAQMRFAQIDDELTEALERWELLGRADGAAAGQGRPLRSCPPRQPAAAFSP